MATSRTTASKTTWEKAQVRFCKLTGYKLSDIMASNEKRYVFVTFSGGKYQMDRRGTKVRVLQGPMPPNVDAVIPMT